MSAEDIELLKLKLQAQMQREQNRADLFKWFVAFAWPLVMHIVTAYFEHAAIANVAEKADVAATKAVALEKTTKDIAKDTAINTAINTSYEARRTGDPDDMAKAERAEAKVEKLADKSP